MQSVAVRFSPVTPPTSSCKSPDLCLCSCFSLHWITSSLLSTQRSTEFLQGATSSYHFYLLCTILILPFSKLSPMGKEELLYKSSDFSISRHLLLSDLLILVALVNGKFLILVIIWWLMILSISFLCAY